MEQAQSVPNLRYTKSRNGCTRCKKRRVKCDERVPCTACIRHQVPCSLSDGPSGSVERTVSDSTLPQGRGRSSASSTPKASISVPLQLPSSSFSDHDCFVSVSEFMTHWTTKAYMSLGPSSEPASMQAVIPQIGFAHPFLLRAILAFSAFHLAYLNPSERVAYRYRASHHQYLALRGLREALQHVTSENCHALFLTAVFVSANTFAGFPSCGRHPSHGCCSSIQNLIEVFSVCQGANTIFAIFSETIARGPASFLFRKSNGFDSAANRLPLFTTRLADLKMIAQTHCDGSIIVETLDAWIAALTNLLSRDYPSSPGELSLLFAWPMVTQAGFVDLISKRHHAALSAIAHYYVLIEWARRDSWCFEGWAGSLMDEITSELRGSLWATTLNWPLQMIA